MTEMNELTVAVVGLGPMGRGIARVFSRAGADVVVADLTPEMTQQGVDTISEESAADGEPVSVRGATLPEAVAAADFFIEAIVERMDAKISLLSEVGEHASSDLIVASNTSSLSIGEMGKHFGDPARFIGVHFFNPPTRMQLVEIVLGSATSEATHQATAKIVDAIGKTAVVSADTPNFIVNRVCRPLYYESQLLEMQGLEAAAVDAIAMKALGHPIGPITLGDLVGLHTHLASSETALREFGDPKYRPIPRVRMLVRNGMTGRAAGRGFYDYAVEKPRAAIERVVRSAPEGDAVPVAFEGPDRLGVDAAVGAESAQVVVYSCHRAPTQGDLQALEGLAAKVSVVVDSSDAGWLEALPAGAEWVRIHKTFDDTAFVEVVDDPVAGVQAGSGVDAVLGALNAESVVVPALPGLVADRLANCVANEAFAVVEEGTARKEDVDTALRLGMNHKLGPFEYVDRAGVRKVYESLRSMLDAFGDDRYRPIQLMRRSAVGQARSER